MDSQKIARELLKVARELMARGTNVDVRDLPDTIRRALKSMRYGRRDIEVIPAVKYNASSGWEGNRAVSITVNISTGRVTDEQVGSWGGSNMFEDRALDRREDKPVPNGAVVIAGSSGGHGKFLSIYVRPDDMGQLMIPEDEAVEMSDDEKRALNVIGGYRGGYRGEEFRRERLGEYGPDNPLIQSLAKKGLVQIMGGGIRITSKGRNAR